MKNIDVIRAWKNEEYRRSLSQAEQALLPAHPAGLIELSGADLESVGGGTWTPITPFLSKLLDCPSSIPRTCPPSFAHPPCPIF